MTVVWHACPVFLDDPYAAVRFDVLVGGKSLLAFQALPASSDDGAVFGAAGIDHFIAIFLAVRTTHVICSGTSRPGVGVTVSWVSNKRRDGGDVNRQARIAFNDYIVWAGGMTLDGGFSGSYAQFKGSLIHGKRIKQVGCAFCLNYLYFLGAQ